MSKTNIFLLFVLFNLASLQILAQYQININQIGLELGEMVDPNSNYQTDLDSLFSFKALEWEKVKFIEKNEALRIYHENIDKEEQEVLPIFEIKNSSKIILPIYGDGHWNKIWAKVVIDKNTMKVLDIKFEHRNEAPIFGAEITSQTFKSNFIETNVNFTQSFSLYQNDKLVLDGEQRVDGISGATITSKGVVNMLNEGLSRYETYLH
ncbi:Na+-transporting NADH:ubiquinone oxidoreductase subunit C [Catalinimonas alkaloidigena]|uniref:Na+-transporting NADH:ubiquinone oxidoreductase subunit C n=1 Tax=Catalinimonas alkaloidigena TaxID=1075417 RepID=A0A1G9LL34_9BACT|nr:FMN-binding protein [Catalinimonas alkaloidigena]SDL62671.1 Na+-transporting NADH:ubiquinone oxidoreductase subunit C [Catalinimonas alkaloidigena]